MRKSEPHTEAGNPAGPSAGKGHDPVSRRAAIAAKARTNPKEQFNNLLHHLTYELVAECLDEIPRSSAAGVDGMSVKQARENLSWLLPPILKQIHEGRYTPPPVRRVYIPKADGSKRPLGVPAVIDRAIQGAMAKVLNEIYEQDFLKCSFGFRRGLGCHHALATINELLYRQRMEHVLEVDIRDFFGSLSHEWLMRFLRLRIGDRRVLALIQAWLKAGIFEEGRWQEVERGTPQGGSASPLLANIYLHYGAPGQTWCFQRVKFPPRQEVQPPHRESSLGSEEVTNRTKRRQSDARAVTKVKRLSLVKYLTAGRQHRSGWKAPVGTPQTARWPETAAGSVSTARSETEASRDLGDPLWSWSANKADRVCPTIGIIPEKGKCCSAKSDSLVVLRARESRVHGEAAKQMKTDFWETSLAPTEAGV
jgi:hypothetical protein